jgi:hypothetical protein
MKDTVWNESILIGEEANERILLSLSDTDNLTHLLEYVIKNKRKKNLTGVFLMSAVGYCDQNGSGYQAFC